MITWHSYEPRHDAITLRKSACSDTKPSLLPRSKAAEPLVFHSTFSVPDAAFDVFMQVATLKLI